MDIIQRTRNETSSFSQQNCTQLPYHTNEMKAPNLPEAPKTLADVPTEILLNLYYRLSNPSRLCLALAHKPYYTLMTRLSTRTKGMLARLFPPDPRSRGSSFLLPTDGLFGSSEYQMLVRRLVLYLPKRVVRDMTLPIRKKGKADMDYSRYFESQWRFAVRVMGRREQRMEFSERKLRESVG